MKTKRSLKAKVAELELTAHQAKESLKSCMEVIEDQHSHKLEIAEALGLEMALGIPTNEQVLTAILELKAKAEKVPALTETPFKPCPNCDSTDIGHEEGIASGCHYIKCRDCHMEGPKTDCFADVKGNGFDIATKAWNNLPRRTTT